MSHFRFGAGHKHRIADHLDSTDRRYRVDTLQEYAAVETVDYSCCCCNRNRQEAVFAE